MYDALDGIKGLSARLIGGGVGLVSRSRLNSAERRGGGGDGGWDGDILGDLRGSKVGVCGRLGILNALGPVAGEAGCESLTSESVLTKCGRSPTAISKLPFGGD